MPFTCIEDDLLTLIEVANLSRAPQVRLMVPSLAEVATYARLISILQPAVVHLTTISAVNGKHPVVAGIA